MDTLPKNSTAFEEITTDNGTIFDEIKANIGQTNDAVKNLSSVNSSHSLELLNPPMYDIDFSDPEYFEGSEETYPKLSTLGLKPIETPLVKTLLWKLDRQAYKLHIREHNDRVKLVLVPKDNPVVSTAREGDSIDYEWKPMIYFR